LEVNFTFDKDKEMERAEKRANEANAHSVPIDSPDVPHEGERRFLPKTPSQEVTVDVNGHRRLAYTTSCEQLYTYVAATHDDWWYDRCDDHTTYFAFVGPYGPCDQAGGGTIFWNDGAWQCYTPDHDANIEYSYGDCFGRCGGGCGSNGGGTYTYDCLDHDSCVRLGHSIASIWCDDEFLQPLMTLS
jgi:hypothetical protein